LLQFSEVIGILEKPQFYSRRCECLMEMKDYESAISDALREIEIDKKPYYRLMDCCLLVGDTNRFNEIVKKFREIAPKIDSIYKNQVPKAEKLNNLRDDIIDLMALNSHSKCLHRINEAFEIAPANVDLQFLKLRCLVVLRQFQEAEKVNEELCKLLKQELDFTNILRSYYEGKVDESMKEFSKISFKLRKKVNPFDVIVGKATRIAEGMAKGKNDMTFYKIFHNKFPLC
jgi:tetratricopeptide (TPR) repeat protein